MCLYIQLFRVFSLQGITINRSDRHGAIVRYTRQSKKNYRLDVLPKKEILEQKISLQIGCNIKKGNIRGEDRTERNDKTREEREGINT